MHHSDAYEKYRNDVRPKLKNEENAIKIDSPTYHERVLFENYFQLVELKMAKATAVCKLCESVLEDSGFFRTNLRGHLRVSLFKQFYLAEFV